MILWWPFIKWKRTFFFFFFFFFKRPADQNTRLISSPFYNRTDRDNEFKRYKKERNELKAAEDAFDRYSSSSFCNSYEYCNNELWKITLSVRFIAHSKTRNAHFGQNFKRRRCDHFHNKEDTFVTLAPTQFLHHQIKPVFIPHDGRIFWLFHYTFAASTWWDTFQIFRQNISPTKKTQQQKTYTIDRRLRQLS